MDFLSSMGLGGEFQTAVGSSVERATSENLVATDWGLNMEICDEVGKLETLHRPAATGCGADLVLLFLPERAPMPRSAGGVRG